MSRRFNSSARGDKLVVTKLDRLGRNVRAVAEIADDLNARGIGLLILQFGQETLDTTGPTGRLMLNVFAAFSQFEREIMLERQAEGIAKAKGEGRYKGGKPTAGPRRRRSWRSSRRRRVLPRSCERPA